MNEECRRYMDDPEANRAHLSSCADCRAFTAEVDQFDERIAAAASVPSRSLDPSFADKLPLAPWEGAQHRSWSVVWIGMVVVVILTILAFASGGMSPVRGFVTVIRQTLTSQMSWLALVRVLPELLQHAPMPFHLLVAAAFIGINLLLYVLMRKAPKGYDASAR